MIRLFRRLRQLIKLRAILRRQYFQFEELMDEILCREAKLERQFQSVSPEDTTLYQKAERKFIEYRHWANVKKFIQLRAHCRELEPYVFCKTARTNIDALSRSMEQAEIDISFFRVEGEFKGVSVAHTERQYLGG